MSTIKPIFLLADSQLLFWREEEGTLFLDRARKLLEEDEPGRSPKAAYLGASNGDAPEFYDLFVAAMGEIGIVDCRMIPSDPQPEDRTFLDEADLILLAGGDVERGWDVFERTGLREAITQRYYAGALLFGVSAGAVQLGIKGWTGDEKLFDTFRLVPFVIDVHEEPSWARLSQIVPRAGEHARGFGIPTGGGALYHADHSVEPIRQPLVEMAREEEGVRQALLLPGQTSEASEEERGTFSPEVQEILDLRPN
ncbi:MAG TPA: Type 1 glutamine amidotransferase-like domain-containing protein [Thermoanaerobaculia bacterium]|nr:Type 1 glutamine amidotransferase-like domain-containing protein [Thermoanaerobaculia bacterium]